MCIEHDESIYCCIRVSNNVATRMAGARLQLNEDYFECRKFCRLRPDDIDDVLAHENCIFLTILFLSTTSTGAKSFFSLLSPSH